MSKLEARGTGLTPFCSTFLLSQADSLSFVDSTFPDEGGGCKTYLEWYATRSALNERDKAEVNVQMEIIRWLVFDRSYKMFLWAEPGISATGMEIYGNTL